MRPTYTLHPRQGAVMPSLAPPVDVTTATALCLQGSIRANVGLQGAPPVALKTTTDLCEPAGEGGPDARELGLVVLREEATRI